ncbi:MAG TPA: hypothetical protein VK138_07155 [Acidiferrobacterales bacterium]|nr:hypothetical protein [Acidiferrobacterales bacterium]
MSIRVEILSAPGCGKCALAKDKLKSVAEEFGPDKVAWREINVLDEIDYAVELGLIAPPAIAINGKLVFQTLPSIHKLREELAKRLCNEI